mgnify:FL=1
MITISWVFLICGTIDVEMVYCLDLELGIVECGNSFRRTDDPDPGQLRKNSVAIPFFLHKSFVFCVIWISNVV